MRTQAEIDGAVTQLKDRGRITAHELSQFLYDMGVLYAEQRALRMPVFEADAEPVPGWDGKTEHPPQLPDPGDERAMKEWCRVNRLDYYEPCDDEQPEAEAEQPKTTPGKRLPPWVRAMQVIPNWIEAWELRYPPDNPKDREAGWVGLREASLRNLESCFKAALQDDEQTRADLLSICEELVEALEGMMGRSEYAEGLQSRARNLIAKAQETDR